MVQLLWRATWSFAKDPMQNSHTLQQRHFRSDDVRTLSISWVLTEAPFKRRHRRKQPKQSEAGGRVRKTRYVLALKWDLGKEEAVQNTTARMKL